MKFIVSSSNLLKQLNSISGVIPSNPIVPILENFHCEISDGKMIATASDLQTTMITEMEVEAQESGRMAVPSRILLDTLKNLPEQPITITIDENSYNIELSSDNGRYKLAGEDASDFPKIPQVEETDSITMSSDVLRSAINNCIFAVSNDELRPAMMGVLLEMSDSNVTFVATDGHRLVRYRRTDLAGQRHQSLIIPKKALQLLRNTLPSENVNVQVDFNDANAFFSFENKKLICRLVDEKFPDYDNVIPADNNNFVTINREQLLNSLRRISIYANKTTHQVRLNIKGSQVEVSAEDLDFSNEANENLSCEHDGEDLEIGFNAKFLIELLNNVDSENIVMHLSTPSKAGLVIPDDKADNEDLLMLVMPVMLNSYT